ncbi:MAG: hypothetical protein MUF07_03175 [Steroidobacteraceae bacterium]|jgi:hypothetical protein|nr:hypothetical protein [Steroidobacteraceae bacterium]
MSIPQPDTVPLGHGRRPTPTHAHIQGWGADLDPAHRPAVPKERTPPRLENVPWRRPEPQRMTVEVLRSTERDGMTAVFGTTLPPSGVSGRIRRTAFRYSENDLRHWLLLLFADRVNVVEGLADDLRRGQVPNLFAEAGGRAALRHDREGTIRKLAVAGVAVAGIGLYLWSRSRRPG